MVTKKSYWLTTNNGHAASVTFCGNNKPSCESIKAISTMIDMAYHKLRKQKNMKHIPIKPLPLGLNDTVVHFDDGSDGRSEKWVDGIVTEVGEYSLTVQWEDLDEETEYEWHNITIKGNQIIENKIKR